MAKEDLKRVGAHFSKGPIAYLPGLSLVFGSVPVSILLGQLIYWSGLGTRRDGFIFKTANELETETGLTDCQQRNAINKLRKYKIIEYKRAGIPAKRHFKVNFEILDFVITRYKETLELVSIEELNLFVKSQRSITESTQRKNQRNTPKEYPRRDQRAGGTSAAKGTSSIGEIMSDNPFWEMFK